MRKNVRVAIINTHPIQYYSPYFRCLHEIEGLDIHVFYGWRGALDDSYDPGFGQNVSWDIELLDGYAHTFVQNTASNPGAHHFRGIVAPDLMAVIEQWGPDAVLVFGWNYQAHLRALRHFHGRIHVLFRGDSTLLDEQPGPRTWLRRLFLRWVYRSVDVALYVGRNNRAYFKTHGFEDDTLCWVPHAIDNERFADAEKADQRATQWRRELGIADEAPVILFAGKLEAKKAPEVLLEAFLALDTPRVHLALAGSGPLEKTLRARTADHPRVHFLGFQNQSMMPVVYRIGDVFVLPSRGPGETWGLAVNEAMACRRPVVVSSKVGCAPDLVDADNGVIVPPDDIAALREALNALLAAPVRLRKMGKRSAQRIQQWSIEEAADRTHAAIQAVVNRVPATRKR